MATTIYFLGGPVGIAVISGLAPGAAVAFLPLFAIEEWRDRRTATESFVEISGRWRGRPRWYEQSRTKRLT